MSTNINELKSLKDEIENEYENGSTSVRVRTDVYKIAQEVAKKKKMSMSKFVTLATLEKAIADTE
ncbi:MAG: hypothetical protein AAGK05_03455 [Pseudomonadota bacterium]